jgi:beta-lactamase regulating signal transducer with metallopeptidase domain
MISLLIEASLRSLLFGLVVAIGLRAFRVRNVVAQKSAWTFVLVAAFAMPLLRPITAQWHILPAGADILLPAHPMTLLEELQAKIQAHGGSGSRLGPIAIPQGGNPWAEKPSVSVPGPARNPHGKETQPKQTQPKQNQSSTARAPQKQTAAAPVRNGVSLAVSQSSSSLNRVRPTLSGLALGFYLGVAGLLVIRLVLGLAATLRLWSTAIPAHTVSGFHASLRLRASTKIHSPVTIGSAILLPADYENWDAEKLRIVLAHERSHIRQGDFYIQLLAGLYAALVWISPLGWWLKRELADLAEAISDRAGIAAAPSRTSYAQILLEFAAMPRSRAIGVAMARPGSLARRIERFLNDHAFHQSFADRRRALVAVLLVPLALFAAAALVRVEAAPVAHSAKKALLASAASLTVLSPAPQPEAADVAEQQIAENQQVSDLSVEGPAVTALASPAPAPEPESQGAALPEIAAALPVPSLFRVAAVAPALAAESDRSSLSFDRTLSVSGETQLVVSTGSGNIRLTKGSSAQIRIHGQIHINREAREVDARAIAANPPIEQNGNTIRVGLRDEHLDGISIDYVIEAPAETLLRAISGSGDIVDEGVGQNAKLETGSGDIRANGLQGPFLVKTGSGNITAEQTGQGDVKAETGSGNIEIKDIHGGFRAQTGSGDIKATGTPSALWNLQTGSGNIDFWPGNAPLTLDASTGSGSVTTDREMLVKGSLDRNHITGNLNGGGTTVRAQTGSGDIHVY